ncbi:hypothetical protein HZC20_03350 [Candidatus Peregrinibacteria bacterium]|nr:hypothetical protein [Candidatus Peregrinibacteria bacterium]
MFITLTIETNKLKNASVKLRKSNIKISKGWRNAVHFRKRSFIQKLKSKLHNWKNKKYILEGQTVMF